MPPTTLFVDLNRCVERFETFDEEAIIAKSTDWLIEHFPELTTGEITLDNIDEAKLKMGQLLQEYMLEHYYTQSEVAKARLDGAIEPLLLTCVDVATDLTVGILLIKRGRYIVGGALLGSFLVTNIVNALVGSIIQRSAVATGMALFGFKPIYDVYISTGNNITRQVVKNVGAKESDTINPDSIILFTHMIEAILESIPAGFIQFSLIVPTQATKSGQCHLIDLLYCDYRLPFRDGLA